jgi:hypothetical protein
MPQLKITTVDDERIVVTDDARLRAEMDRYEAAIDALIPALAGDDDEAGRPLRGAIAPCRSTTARYLINSTPGTSSWRRRTARRGSRLPRS